MNELFTVSGLGISKNIMEQYKVYNIVPEKIEKLLSKTEVKKIHGVIEGIFLNWLTLNEEIITLLNDKKESQINRLDVEWNILQTVKIAINNSCTILLKVLKKYLTINYLLDIKNLFNLKYKIFCYDKYPYAVKLSALKKNDYVQREFIIKAFAKIVIPCYLQIRDNNMDILLAYYKFQKKAKEYLAENERKKQLTEDEVSLNELITTFYKWVEELFPVFNVAFTSEELEIIAHDKDKKEILTYFFELEDDVYPFDFAKNYKQYEKINPQINSCLIKYSSQKTMNAIFGEMNIREKLIFISNHRDELDLDDKYNFLFFEVYSRALHIYICGSRDEEENNAAIILTNHLIIKILRFREVDYLKEKKKEIALDYLLKIKNNYHGVFDLLCKIKVQDLKEINLYSLFHETGLKSKRLQYFDKYFLKDETLKEAINNTRIIDFLWFTNIRAFLSFDESNTLEYLEKIIKLGFNPKYFYFNKCNKLTYSYESTVRRIAHYISKCENPALKTEFFKKLVDIYPDFFTDTSRYGSYICYFTDDRDLSFFKKMGTDYKTFRTGGGVPYIALALIFSIGLNRKRVLLDKIIQGKFKEDLNVVCSFEQEKYSTLLSKIEDLIAINKRFLNEFSLWEYYDLLEIKETLIDAGAKTYEQVLKEKAGKTEQSKKEPSVKSKKQK